MLHTPSARWTVSLQYTTPMIVNKQKLTFIFNLRRRGSRNVLFRYTDNPTTSFTTSLARQHYRAFRKDCYTAHHSFRTSFDRWTEHGLRQDIHYVSKPGWSGLHCFIFLGNYYGARHAHIIAFTNLAHAEVLKHLVLGWFHSCGCLRLCLKRLTLIQQVWVSVHPKIIYYYFALCCSKMLFVNERIFLILQLTFLIQLLISLKILN